MKKILLTLAVVSIAFSASAGRIQKRLSSPAGNITVTVDVADHLSWSVGLDGRQVLDASAIEMKLDDGTVWGASPRLRSAKTASNNSVIEAPFWKDAEIVDNYNSLMLTFAGGFAVEFRAYDDAAAYRFVSTRKGEYKVTDERTEFNFPQDHAVYCPYVKRNFDKGFEAQFFNSFENTYAQLPLSGIDKGRLMFLPVLVDLGDGTKMCITESDLESYAGMFMASSGAGSLKGVFAPVPDKWHQGGHNMLQKIVDTRHPYIASCNGARSFPWRVVILSNNDADLIGSNAVYRLAAPSRLTDIDWIRPGKVAWEWWNNWGLYGVDFKAGVNTPTYKHYIDFAAEKGIEYVILDEGWSVNKAADLMQVVTDIDLKEIIDYGASNGVGIILWAGHYAFDRDMETVCRHYAAMGVKGFKIDFMDSDDQTAVDFYYRSAATCARYGLIVDFHGAYKPTGLSRTYPNVLNFEGVHGLEQMKWSLPTVDQVTYDVTIPYIRMVAGPMDYTQGAMRNAARKAYVPNNAEPMSQGTRCHQLAMYTVFFSPFNMLCDSPDNYRKEPVSTDFIASIPTVWDQTVPLDGKVGEYAVVARRSGKSWYVGGLNGWTARTAKVDLSFLPEGDYSLRIMVDGPNAAKIAQDFLVRESRLGAQRSIEVEMAQGGGFAAVITPVE